MARIRSIHPNACKSRKLARSSAEAERCYWRLQPHCDDDGRVEDEPDVLASLMFQAGVLDGDGEDTEPVPPSDVDDWLNQLAVVGLIVRYETASGHVIQVTQWPEYQHPKRPTKSRLGAPPDPDSPTCSPHVPHTSPTCSPRSGVEWSGEGEGAGGETASHLTDAVAIVEQRRHTFEQSRTKGNPSAWLARARQGIRDELTAIVPEPTSPTAWADIIEPPDPTAQRAAAAAALAEHGMSQLRGEVCEHCQGSGFIQGEGDYVIDCPHCK